MNKKIQFEIKIEENLGTIYTMPIWEAHGMFKAPDELDEAIETISKDMKKIILDYLEK